MPVLSERTRVVRVTGICVSERTRVVRVAGICVSERTRVVFVGGPARPDGARIFGGGRYDRPHAVAPRGQRSVPGALGAISQKESALRQSCGVRRYVCEFVCERVIVWLSGPVCMGSEGDNARLGVDASTVAVTNTI